MNQENNNIRERLLAVSKQLASLEEPVRRSKLKQLDEQGVNVGRLPIVPIAKETGSPLSYAQMRQWFLWKLDPESTAYHITGGLRLDGQLDVDALKAGFHAIVARHESLRTVFREGADGTVEQVIDLRGKVEFPVVDLTTAAEQIEGKLTSIAKSIWEKPFDLETGPLCRIVLAKVAHNEHVLVVAMHHIVSDGWSMQIILRELAEGYNRRIQGEAPQFEPLSARYADYAVWQKDWLESGEMERQRRFWSAHLGREHPVLELPVDYPSARNGNYRVAHHLVDLPESLVISLRKTVQERGGTLFMGLLAAFQVLLQRYTGQDDLRIGVPIANRNRAETAGVVGFFVNTLVLRGLVTPTASLASVFEQVKGEVLAAQSHQDLPFETLVEALQPERTMNRSPLFQVMFNHEKDERKHLMRLQALHVSDFVTGDVATQFEVTLNCREDESGRLSFQLSYARELFEAETIERMAKHYVTVLHALAGQSQLAVGEVDLLGKAERARLAAWGVNAERHPEAQPVHRLIEARVLEHPDGMALVFGDEVLSYAELNSQANRLAHRLIALGVGPEVQVGVALERSVELVVLLLAILKAGGAYVPLDPDYPSERLSYMLSDSGIGLLVTHSTLRDRLPTVDGVQVREIDGLDLADEPDNNPDVPVSGENLAYVIYTSGSTGKPKGAANRHRSLYNRLMWMQQAYGLDDGDTVLQKTPYSFDVSVWEFFWPLMTGARLAIANPGDHRDPARLVEQIQRNAVTTLHFVPSMLQAFLAHEGIEACTSLKRIVCSGEALPAEAQAGVFARLSGVALYNLYGPTEAAIDVTHWTCCDDGNTQVPIGKPISDTKAYVLDSSLNLAPLGVAGELYLGGVGLARGYLNRATLTAERFIADPLDEQGARLYRTGDLVKWSVAGELEYLGRIDHQVKIRGFRIELGEVEAKLLSQPEVREAVVVAANGLGGARLVAYVSLHELIEVQELRKRLGQELPEYMVPGVLIVLDTLPLNANGKIDRKALPVPEVGVDGEYEAPEGEVEETLVRIWSEVLKVPQEQIGRHSNFFELGGDSILSLQVVARARREGYTIMPRQVFEHQALATLAGALAGATDAFLAIQVLGDARRAAALPLSYAQQRLWFLWNLDPESTAYHIGTALKLTGLLDVDALSVAFDGLVARHEALRTVFWLNEAGEAEQVIQPSGGVVLEVRNLEGRDPVQEVAQIHSASFDLTTGPLLRAVLLRESGNRHVLVMVMHHIVSDDWTMKLVVDELIEVYRAGREGREPTLVALPIQYADYAVWQHDWLERGERERQLAYWKAVLDGDLPVLDLTTDHPRRSDGRYSQALHRLELPAEVVEGLRVRAKETQGTLFMGLLTGVHALLHRYSGQEDIRVGVPVANRHHPGTEGVIGVFINTQVLRARLGGHTTFAVLLEQVKASALGAQEHQDLPFEELVDALQPDRSLSRTPLFQVMFNHLREDEADRLAQLPGLSLEGYGDSVEQEAKFELTVGTSETADGRVRVAFEYARELFEPETIERMAGHYVAVLRALAEDPKCEIGALELLGETERTQLAMWGLNAERYPDTLPVHRLIAAQVRLRPNAVALVFGDETLSYAELNARANRLAHWLIDLGVAPEVRVGVMLERSPELVVSLLAILKAGGAYVPLDPDYPVERQSYVVGNSGINLLITHSTLRTRLPMIDGIRVLEVDTLDFSSHPALEPQVSVSGEYLMYVIYTSGSTGKPKGVAVPHAAVSNCLLWMQHAYKLATGETVLHKAPFGFDVSVWELFWPLTVGARLVVAAPGEHRDVERLVELIRDHEVTAINFVPAMLKAFLLHDGCQKCTGLKHIMCGGEAVGADLPRVLGKQLPTTKLHDLYGPTETTIHVTHWTCDNGDRNLIPIGRPIADNQAYVLGDSLRLVPQGVAGELYLGGAGLARGYLNRPFLTAERFVANPFNQYGGRLYRTGDLVRWNVDGELEYLGRIDHQVKIRGFRIELGEIEAALVSQPEVREAVVVASEGSGGARLVSYVSLDRPVEVAELRQRLGSELPEYMVPNIIMVMESLPLNENGKIDRKMLPAPEVVAEGEYEAPVGEEEEALVGIWSEVLGVPLERVGRHSNFFELGGDSISMLKLQMRIAKTLNVRIGLRELFERPHLKGMGILVHHFLRIEKRWDEQGLDVVSSLLESWE